MTQKDDDGFFVGYNNAAPGSLSWFLPLVGIGLVVLFAAVGYFTAAGQKSIRVASEFLHARASSAG